MKKLLVLLISLVMINSVFAQSEVKLEAGLKPDSPFYFLDKFIEQVQLAFTRDEVKKAQLYLEIASERLEELKELNEEENDEFNEDLEEEFEKDLNIAENLGNDIRELAKKKEFDNLVIQATSHHIEVLEKVLEKVPKKAKDAIKKVIERSERGHERAIEDIKKALDEEIEDKDTTKEEKEKIEEEKEKWDDIKEKVKEKSKKLVLNDKDEE